MATNNRIKPEIRFFAFVQTSLSKLSLVQRYVQSSPPKSSPQSSSESLDMSYWGCLQQGHSGCFDVNQVYVAPTSCGHEAMNLLPKLPPRKKFTVLDFGVAKRPSMHWIVTRLGNGARMFWSQRLSASYLKLVFCLDSDSSLMCWKRPQRKLRFSKRQYRNFGCLEIILRTSFLYDTF